MKRNPPKNDAQLDMFVPGFYDIAPRDAHETMERPFFSISKNPRFEPIMYESDDKRVFVVVSGGKPDGIATIWDKDILIWAVSQIREAIDRGEEPLQTIFFHPYQLLKAVRRPIGGEHYKRLKRAMTRLTNTTVKTSIRADKKTMEKGFHWLDDYTTAEDNQTGEAAGMWSITLSRWMYQAALNQARVLTLDDDYFLLTGGLERWLYLIARKHGGRQQNGWRLTMRVLYEKSGSTRLYKLFAQDIRKIVQEDELPGYHLEIWRGADGVEQLHFNRRSNLAFSHLAYQPDLPRNVKKVTGKLSTV